MRCASCHYQRSVRAAERFAHHSLSRNDRRLEGCDEMHMAASALQALREAKDMAATVVIRDVSLETPPHFLDSLPPNVRLTAKPSRAATV